MKKIIWFTEWYPVESEPYNGDQVERLAQAASLFSHIHVVYVKKDARLPAGKIIKEERRYNENCSAVIWYYPSVSRLGSRVEKIFSACYFFKLHFRSVRDYKKKFGRPDGIQVNVSMRNGIVALWYRFFGGIKYIVLERWGLYLREAKPHWREKNFLYRYFTKKIFANASAVTAVSAHLADTLKKDMRLTECGVIPNVTDSSVFFHRPVQKEGSLLRFVHISNLDYAKNIHELLAGFKLFLDKGYKAELILHAPVNEELEALVHKQGLEKNILLRTETGQQGLADTLREADALILFSRYETFGIVVIEAQACGVPVITSNYPVFNETVQDGINGIIADGTDAQSLTSALVEFTKCRHQFKPEIIAADTAVKYSYSRIGKMLEDLYREVFTS
jgi:glycosyltransferase involved in cell wall biosynthesis